MATTSEMIDYLKEICPGRFLSEITKIFNEHFGTDKTVAQVREIKKHNRIKSFVKGNDNNEHSIATQYKKGHESWNRKKIGDVCFRKFRGSTEKRYAFIKVAEPNKWELYHRWLWEKENGSIPKGYCLYFIDGNPEHCTLDNIALIERSILAILNHSDMTDDSEINRVLITRAKLLRKMYDKGAKNVNKY